MNAPTWRRAAFAAEHMHERTDMEDVVWIDEDEKWFDMWSNRGKQYLSPLDQEMGIAGHVGRTPRPNAAHPPKIMFLCAVAEPVPARDFDGRIGIWDFTDEVYAQRSSHRRPAGTLELKSKNVTAELWEHMFREKVIPAALEKCKWAKKIIFQVDGATPHVAALKNLRAYGETVTPRVEFVQQPANSPDTNINDLAFFASLKAGVYTPQEEDDFFDDLLDLRARVREVYDTYHSTEKLQKLFRLKRAVMAEIVAHRGGNQFPMPHGGGAPPRNVRATTRAQNVVQ